MHSPAYLRKRAHARYKKFLLAWLQDEPFFPLRLSVGKVDVKDYAHLQNAVNTLNEHSKATLGYGYSVESTTRRTRQLGQQTVPRYIVFDDRKDYLRYLGSEKVKEFKNFAAAVAAIRARQPRLEDWLLDHINDILKYQGKWDDLLTVCQYFLDNPQPQQYLRELPIPVHTKFIEQHQPILDALLQQLLPTSAYQADANDFYARYGIRHKVPLIRLRLLDDTLLTMLNWVFEDFALPLDVLSDTPLAVKRCIIVENELTFLTLPALPGSIAIWGEGFKACLLGQVRWLDEIEIIYWGDIDAQGFQILSILRSHFSHVRSILMDEATFTHAEAYIVHGTTTSTTALLHLRMDERQLYQHVLEHHLRLEQEHIDQEFVKNTIRKEIRK